jgi:hypothetical protein
VTDGLKGRAITGGTPRRRRRLSACLLAGSVLGAASRAPTRPRFDR